VDEESGDRGGDAEHHEPRSHGHRELRREDLLNGAPSAKRSEPSCVKTDQSVP